MKTKDPNKKRGYWGFFARTFALILVAVIVVGLVACWGFYQYDTGSERDAAADRINRLRAAGYDAASIQQLVNTLLKQQKPATPSFRDPYLG